MDFTKVSFVDTYDLRMRLTTCPVSDVFHTGNPDTALWEFKHGNGSFKRGDLVGLREIKRRASRHALVHRDYSNQKPTPSQPGTPAEPMPMPQDTPDARLDYTLHDMEMRLRRSEESAHYMHVKQQALMETMGRLLRVNQELSRAVLSLVPSPENPIHRDGRLLVFASVPLQALMWCSCFHPVRHSASGRDAPSYGRASRAPVFQQPSVFRKRRECSGFSTTATAR